MTLRICIRELEWTGPNDRQDAAAFGLDVFYRVEGTPGAWTLMSPGPTAYVRTAGYSTQSAAKAAAAVDFERRIRTELREWR